MVKMFGLIYFGFMDCFIFRPKIALDSLGHFSLGPIACSVKFLFWVFNPMLPGEPESTPKKWQLVSL